MTGAAQPAPSALPRADLFDILPAVHELLARVDRHQNETAIGGEVVSDGEDNLYADLAPLDVRELPAEVLAVKAKIRRVLRNLEKLPDMSRTTEQQEQEIAELEAKIDKQRQSLRQLRDMMQTLTRPATT